MNIYVCVRVYIYVHGFDEWWLPFASRHLDRHRYKRAIFVYYFMLHIYVCVYIYRYLRPSWWVAVIIRHRYKAAIFVYCSIYVCLYTYICVCVCMCTCVCIYTYMHIYIYIYMHIYIYIFIYIGDEYMTSAQTKKILTQGKNPAAANTVEVFAAVGVRTQILLQCSL